MSNENLTEKTLADVQAGIPARDAEIETLRKENTELREQLEAVGAGGVNGRLMPGAAPVSGADGLRVVLEEIHDWMDSQADAQSKGCHATFDIMMLRELRDKAKFALDHLPDATKMVPGDQFRDAAQMIEPSESTGELDERAEFETWVAERDGFPYAGQFLNLMWAAWQARAALAQQDADNYDGLVYRTLLDNCISCEVNYEEDPNYENMVRDFILTFRLGGNLGNNIRGMLSKPLSEFAERCMEFDAACKEPGQ